MRYNEYLRRKQKQYGKMFDPSDLNKDFIPYFDSGERIKVDFGNEVKTGTVGVTTGWKPCFLLMRYRTSTGSVYTIGPNDKVVAKWSEYKNRYIPT